MKKLLLIVIVVFSVISCEDVENTELNLDANIVSISYGTSFGECLGYCKQTIEIEGTVVKFIANSWTENDNFPIIELFGTISEEEWESLISEIDFIVFRNLEEVIGCPDCADGGAEWIEIETNELTHKITFEFNNPPEEVQEYIDELVALYSDFQKKIF